MKASKFDLCRIDKDGIYLPKIFIEQVLDDFNERYINFCDADKLFSAGRIYGGMDVYSELLKKIEERNERL